MTTDVESLDRSKDTTAAGISWARFHECRRRFRGRWPTVWHLPVQHSFFSTPRLRDQKIASVLDVGATTRVWEDTIRRQWTNVDYRSLDIDRTYSHEYYSFDAVDRRFDLVTLLEVLEHVSPPVALELLAQCSAVCQPGGHILVSVPNVLAPGYQLEFTHQTAYSYYDLAGLLDWVGLEVVDGWRFFPATLKRRLLHEYLCYPLHRLLKVDFCQSVVMLARKPPHAGTLS